MVQRFYSKTIFHILTNTLLLSFYDILSLLLSLSFSLLQDGHILDNWHIICSPPYSFRSRYLYISLSLNFFSSAFWSRSPPLSLFLKLCILDIFYNHLFQSLYIWGWFWPKVDISGVDSDQIGYAVSISGPNNHFSLRFRLREREREREREIEEKIYIYKKVKNRHYIKYLKKKKYNTDTNALAQ